MTEELKALKENEAVVIYCGNKDYFFWNYENGRLLIADWASEMPNYYNIAKIGSNFIVIEDRSFEKKVRVKLSIQKIGDKHFYFSLNKIKSNREVTAEKV